MYILVVQWYEYCHLFTGWFSGLGRRRIPTFCRHGLVSTNWCILCTSFFVLQRWIEVFLRGCYCYFYFFFDLRNSIGQSKHEVGESWQLGSGCVSCTSSVSLTSRAWFLTSACFWFTQWAIFFFSLKKSLDGQKIRERSWIEIHGPSGFLSERGYDFPFEQFLFWYFFPPPIYK